MLPIATSALEDWKQTVSETASLVIAGRKMSLVSTAGTDAAYLSKNLQARPGETIHIKCMARRISGLNNTSGSLALEYPGGDSLRNRVEIRSKNWEAYHVEFTVPLTADPVTERVQATVGMWTGLGGEVEIADLVISTSNSSMPVGRVSAAGLITIADGVPEINQSFVNVGIKAVSYSGNELSITIPPMLSNFNLAPVIIADITNDTNPQIVAKAGQFNRTTGVVKVKFVDVTTGNFVSLTLLGTLYVNILAIGI